MSKYWEQEIERLRGLSEDAAQAELSSAVYAACVIVERLESAGRIVGNAHHIRQDIAAYAAAKLAERLKILEGDSDS
jgi:hypothetical protein